MGGGHPPLQCLWSPARAKPAGQAQEERPGALWQEWEQGLGPLAHMSRLHAQALLTAARRRAQPRLRDLPPLCQGRDGVLTHAKLSLGIQLKALGAAFILFCRAKRTGLEDSGCRDRAAVAVAPARPSLPPAGPCRGSAASVLSHAGTRASASPLLAQASAVGRVMRGSHGLAQLWLADTEIIAKYKADRTGEAAVLTVQRRGLGSAGVSEHRTGQRARGRVGADCVLGAGDRTALATGGAARLMKQPVGARWGSQRQHLYSRTLPGRRCHAHFTDGHTEAQGGLGSAPKVSQPWSGVAGFEPGSA